MYEEKTAARVPSEITMIEKVARALAKIDGLDPDDDPNYVGPGGRSEAAYPPGTRLWWRYRRNARAAIEAMREPTEVMKEACRGVDNDEYIGVTEKCAREVWHAMIDEAIK